MPYEYSKIKKENKDIVFLVNANGNKVKLEMPYITLSGTYPGTWINSPIENVAKIFRQFPDFQEIGYETENYLKSHGFKEVEPSEIDKLVYH